MSALSLTALLAAGLTSALACAVTCYALWLARGRPREVTPLDGDAACPALDVIVAVFNERALLPGKLHNLSRLAYPAGRLRFIIVDGASTDGSNALALEWARRDDRFLVVSTASPGKAAQLNLALRHAQAPWTVVTDVDARMRADTLTCLMTAAARNPALGLVGSPVMPVNVHPCEQLYWRLLNWLRRQEWCRGSASMVMAPCYAFRRTLIDHIPEDVVSDDLSVAWRVGSFGYPIGLAGPVVHEVRGPATARGLFRQKCRRGAGLLREVFRFMPLASEMIPSLRSAFLLRGALFLVTPLVVLTAALAAGMVLLRLPALEAGAAVALSAVVGTLLVRLPDGSRVRRPLALAALLTLSATASLLCYPFFSRTGFFRTQAFRLRPKVP
jgi:cellulose synthase/poly-beta-1,6-N-acetylglucosamine synthase-like glycosyltransferase